jgi:glycosyltransferase involved in cell wall biosynthesis
MSGPVLVACASHQLGGSERILLDWVPELGSEAVVACPEGPLRDGLLAGGTAWRPLRRRAMEVRPTAGDRVREAGRLLARARELAAAMRGMRPATVVAWGMPSLVSAATALVAVRPRPRLVFVHVDLLPAGPMRHAVVQAAQRAQRVVTLSRDAASDLDRRGTLRERIAVVHPGVDLERFAAAPWPEGPPRALLSGAIVGWKRPDLALEIVARAAATLPGLTLDVLGAPLDSAGETLLRTLRRRAEEPDLAGRVRFLGRVDDPRGAVADAQALLHCADREPFGLVVPEALALGRPVVAPAAGGPAEVVTAECGRLFAPGDAAAGAAALIEVLRSPEHAREMGSAGRRRVEAEFDAAGSRRRFAAAVASA